MIEQFHFLKPFWLLALLPLALLLYLLFRSRRNSSPWHKLIDPSLQSLLLDGSNPSARRGYLWLLGIVWLLAVLALANPSWSELPTPMLQSTASRVIVLDLSRSMYAADVKPSRIEQARFKVADILRYEEEGQTGLIVFAGDAFTVSPLTRDTDTVTTLLMAVSPNIMPVQGSRLELGLKLAGDVLSQAGIGSGEIVAITDGYSGDAAVRQARRLQNAGHRVSVLGVGSMEGAPIADTQGVYLRDEDGNVVITKLDPAKLKAVTEAGGGRYHDLSSDNTDIKSLLGSGLTAQQEEAVDEGLTAVVWDEKGPLIALLLLPLAAFVFRRGWLLSVAVLLSFMVQPNPAHAGWWQDLWWRQDQQAQQAFRNGDYDNARKMSENPVLQGSADYRRGDYEAAARTFDRVVSEDAEQDSVDNADKDIPNADAAYNLGNALASLGRLEDAVQAYDRALEIEPSMDDAIANRSAVLEALEQQQEQEQSGDGEGEGDEDSQSDGEGNADGDPTSDASGGDQQNSETEQSAGDESEDTDSESEESEQSDPSEQQQSSSDSFSDASEQLDQQQQEEEQESEQSDDSESEQADNEQSQQQAEQSDAESSDAQENSEQTDASDATGEQISAAQDEAEELSSEEQLAAEQWLRRIPDDPGGLLRRKFRYQYRRRTPPPTNDRQTW